MFSARLVLNAIIASFYLIISQMYKMWPYVFHINPVPPRWRHSVLMAPFPRLNGLSQATLKTVVEYLPHFLLYVEIDVSKLPIRNMLLIHRNHFLPLFVTINDTKIGERSLNYFQKTPKILNQILTFGALCSSRQFNINTVASSSKTIFLSHL